MPYEAKQLDVFDKHQLRIARQTLKYSDAGALIMGGMSKGAYGMLSAVVHDLSNLFEADNANFDRSKFLSACGF